jgi:hypothetical protein
VTRNIARNPVSETRWVIAENIFPGFCIIIPQIADRYI